MPIAKDDIARALRQLALERLTNKSTMMFAIGAAEWPGISKLIEEAGEVVQVCGKLMATYGDPIHWEGPSLIERLEDEIADVIAAAHFVIDTNKQLSETRIAQRIDRKVALFEKWHAAGDPSSTKLKEQP